MKKLLLLIVLTGIAGISFCQQKKQRSDTLNIIREDVELSYRVGSLRTICYNDHTELQKLSNQIAQTEGELKKAKKPGSGADRTKIDSLQREVLALTGKKKAIQPRFDRELDELDSLVGRLNKVIEQLPKEQQHH